MANPYNQDLDQNPANYQPLTPLSFLERAADVFPDSPLSFTATFEGPMRDFYLRSKKLASALSKGHDSRKYRINLIAEYTSHARGSLWYSHVWCRYPCY
jgi:hypothetical protein